MMRDIRAFAAVAVVVGGLGMAGCGGDDASLTDSSSVTQTGPTAADGDGSDGDGTGDGTDPGAGASSAQVVVGDQTYAFTQGGCTLANGAIISQFFGDGGDALNLTVDPEGNVLLRMTIDGEVWNGSTDAPVVSGNQVSWSGQMGVTDSGTREDAQLTMSC